MIRFRNISAHYVEKLYDLKVSHKGFQIPVSIYLVEENRMDYYYHCVCFENTRFDQHLSVNKHEDGEWFDRMDRDDGLAKAIGNMIDIHEQSFAAAS